jgi:arylsulfatase
MGDAGSAVAAAEAPEAGESSAFSSSSSASVSSVASSVASSSKEQQHQQQPHQPHPPPVRCRCCTRASGYVFLVVAGMALVALSVALAVHRFAHPPPPVHIPRGAPRPNALNVVLFYVDDWSYKTLGHLNGVVQTPHIDKLARHGISFSHNCVTTSICWQSRATLYTGLYASVHQQYSIHSDNMYDKTVPWKETLYPQLFTAGYRVGFFGKYHAPMPPAYLAYTFDEFKDYWGEHWLERDGRLRHVTDLNKEDALSFLRTVRQSQNNTSGGGGGRPAPAKFALTVSFFATHAWDDQPFPNQYMPMNYSASRYDANLTIPIPKTATQEAWEHMPWFFTEANEGRKRWRQRFDGNHMYQESMKRMYRMATEVDDAIGAIMDELQNMGVLNETMIVFTSDNGNFHGGTCAAWLVGWSCVRRPPHFCSAATSHTFHFVAEHGLADKWYPHEESLRVPLIIVDPRMPDPVRGSSRDDRTLSIDLAPTLLSAAEIAIPRHMQGRDVADLYMVASNSSSSSSTVLPWRTDFFYEFVQQDYAESYIPSVLALVHTEYKYLYWPQSGYEQLFHVGGADPYEEDDVFNTTDPAVREAIKARYGHLKELSQRGVPV